MNNDPYLGITKALSLYDAIKIIIDDNNYISVQLFEKQRIKYYEVTFINNEKQIFLGKFYKEDYLFNVSYKNGKILIHNDEFDHGLAQMQIKEVLALYDIIDDIFYYCTEENAVKIFDETIDSSNIKRKNNKLLRSSVKRRFFDNNNDLNIKKSNEKISNIINIQDTSLDNLNYSNEPSDDKTNIIKFHR